MKILVTGAGGMLGSDLCFVLKGTPHETAAYTREQLDVRDFAQASSIIAAENPDCVIHTAAFTNVDESQRNPETAYAANAVGAWNVALACARVDAALVYVSSCGIFDGAKAEPYTEFDQPAPLTHYARSKFLGEQYTAAHCPKHFIVRPGWLFGGSSRHARNFVAARRREASAKPELVSAKDKFGSPTYTVDFANQILKLIESEAYGTYHAGGTGYGSRYEYVSEIIKLLDLPNPVRPVGSDAFPRSAPVPAWEALDNTCLRLRGLLMMRPWQEAIADYVTNRFLPEVNAQ